MIFARSRVPSRFRVTFVLQSVLRTTPLLQAVVWEVIPHLPYFRCLALSEFFSYPARSAATSDILVFSPMGASQSKLFDDKTCLGTEGLHASFRVSILPFLEHAAYLYHLHRYVCSESPFHRPNHPLGILSSPRGRLCFASTWLLR